MFHISGIIKTLSNHNLSTFLLSLYHFFTRLFLILLLILATEQAYSIHSFISPYISASAISFYYSLLSLCFFIGSTLLCFFIILFLFLSVLSKFSTNFDTFRGILPYLDGDVTCFVVLSQLIYHLKYMIFTASFFVVDSFIFLYLLKKSETSFLIDYFLDHTCCLLVIFEILFIFLSFVAVPIITYNNYIFRLTEVMEKRHTNDDSN